MEDAARIEALLNLCSQHDLGEIRLETGELQREWQAPNFSVAESTYALFAADEPIAYAELWDIEPPYVRARGGLAVHPAWRGRGIEAHLLAWLIETSKRNLARAPQTARVVLGMSADSRLSERCAFYEQYGFRHVRSYYQMRLDMDAPPPEPKLPEGITLRTFRKGQDERATFEAFDEAFRDHFGHIGGQFASFEHYALNNPLADFSMWYLAMAGEQIAGICLCSKYIPEDPAMGWVEDLAVRRPYRKRGLGLALLHTAFGEFYRRGYRRVGLAVDSQNLTGALRLYERAGMRPERTWLRYHLVLREGEVLDARALSTD
jgi:mycothiol synthase